MAFISKDFRSPGEAWVKTDEGWERKKVLECGGKRKRWVFVAIVVALIVLWGDNRLTKTGYQAMNMLTIDLLTAVCYVFRTMKM